MVGVVPHLITDGVPGGRGALVWRLGVDRNVLSSAAVGGGLTRSDWILNIGVGLDYGETDLEDHVDRVAAALGLEGSGVGLITADATVGVTKPTWAADAGGGWSRWEPGTINVVVQCPVRLSQGAAVNAVITATEAKSQALFEGSVPGTGTASDAVAIVWPDSSPAGRGQAPAEAMFAGPRSEWGAMMAQAVYGSVAAGLDRWKSRERR